MSPSSEECSRALIKCKVACKTSSSLAKKVFRSRTTNAYLKAELPLLPVAAPKPEGEFVWFTKLPKEIQIAIWEIIVADSRLIIQVIERAKVHWLTGKCQFRKHYWRKKFMGISNIPTALHICSFSRDLFLKRWENVPYGRYHDLDSCATEVESSPYIIELCFVDCVGYQPSSPRFSYIVRESHDITMIKKGLPFVAAMRAKTVALDLSKWADVESESCWYCHVAFFLRCPVIPTLDKVILFYSPADMHPDKLALTKSMIEDFRTGVDSPLSRLRGLLIRFLIQNYTRYEGFKVEDWVMPIFEFVDREEWRQRSGVWRDVHESCLHHAPGTQGYRYKISSLEESFVHGMCRAWSLFH